MAVCSSVDRRVRRCEQTATCILYSFKSAINHVSENSRDQRAATACASRRIAKPIACSAAQRCAQSFKRSEHRAADGTMRTSDATKRDTGTPRYITANSSRAACHCLSIECAALRSVVLHLLCN